MNRMAHEGATLQEAAAHGRQQVNWAEKYIEKLSRDMEEIRGMEGRINSKIDNLQERIDANGRRTQNLVLAMTIGIGAMTIATALALK